MARIKICGIRRQEDVSYVNELMPDYVGFILSSGFRRSIDMDTFAQLTQSLDNRITRIVVFVNEPIDTVQRAIAMGVDMVQLHGDESPEYCASISAPVIKVLKPDSFHRAGEYQDYVDYFLFDSGTGTGKTFDWSILPHTAKPFFLAGGISADNLSQAIKNVNPFAVDMSSSVETDGKKDYDKIKQVIDITRSTK